MDLHRYKVKLPRSKHEPDELGMLGIWIGFAGIFLISSISAFVGNFKDASETFSIVIGVCYFLYWLGLHHRFPIVLLALLSEVVAIILLLPLSFDSFLRLTSNICSVKKFQPLPAGCLSYSDLGTAWCYFIYLTSIAILSAYYHKRRENTQPR